jgi:type II secretory pathway component GspD/PulD (secretin)
MSATKLRTLAAAVLCCGLALAVGSGTLHFANAQPDPKPKVPLAQSGGAGSPAPKLPDKFAPAEAEKKVLCVIPLKKLDAKTAAEKLVSLLPNTVTVAAVRDENALLVYASAKGTDDVKLVLRTLGEELPKDTPKPADPMAKPKVSAVKKYTFGFRNTPWADVLDWYSKESGLVMITTVKPTGTVTLGPSQDKQFTLAEITDIINEALAQQKLILIRREKSFLLHPADEKVDPAFFRRVEPTELPELARTELAEVQLALNDLDAGEIGSELRKLLTPFGEIAFAKGKVLIVRDTVGNIERIRQTITAIEKPAAPRGGGADPWKPAGAEPVLKRLNLQKPLVAADVAKNIEKAFAGQQLQVIPLPNENDVLVLASADLCEQIANHVRALQGRPKVYSIRFDKKSWKDVFAWYAAESGLTYVGAALPTGTFTFGAQNDLLDGLTPMYTLAEVTDHINDALLKQNWLLVRNDKSFAVVPADEKVDPKWVPQITINELPKRGRTELVQVVLTPKGLLVTDILPDIKKLLGPFGSAIAFRNDSLVIQDIAGNILKIKKTLDELEKK